MKHVHILGICGTFMGGVAAIAREAGYRVTGSDRGIYPPMSDQLGRLGIDLVEGFEADQLDPVPDMVVVGNVMSRGMPVIEEVLNRQIPYMSGPEWLAATVLRDRRVVAVSGTHGKTTTTSLLAWILQNAGREAGYLIGGAAVDFDFSARLGSDPVFVIEADEYDTAFFDKRAKFLHYRPETLIINNLEFDHADIFPDLQAIVRQFHQLVRAVPGNGRLIVPAGDPNIDALLKLGCWTEQERFSSRPDAAADVWQGREDPPGTFRLRHRDRDIGSVPWGLGGAHNAENATAAFLAAVRLGVEPAKALEGIASFGGVRRRLQQLGDHAGVRLFDDFAHHPTAIRRTIQGLRVRPDVQRVLAVFEPRSNSMKLGTWEGPLVEALGLADVAWIHRSDGLRWDLEAAFRESATARVSRDIDGIVTEIVAESRPGDVVVVMSNGAFHGIHALLGAALEGRNISANDDSGKNRSGNSRSGNSRSGNSR